jgi:outer membrane autotransporter protein
VAGIEWSVGPGIRSGFAFGHFTTTVAMKDLRDSGTEDSFQGSLYGSMEKGMWYLDTAVSSAWNHYDMERPIAFESLSRTARASYNGYELSGYAETGYHLKAGGFRLTPLVSFMVAENHRDGFTEKGADSLNLVSENAATTSLQGAPGAKLARTFTLREGCTLTPELSARWIHEFGDTEALLHARFAGSPSGSFTVYSNDRDDGGRDSAAASLGVRAALGDRLDLQLFYDGEFKSAQVSHAVIGGLQLRW